MSLEEIRQGLVARGEDPDDFDITIFENGYGVSPKWHYETKQIAKKEDLKLSAEVFYDIMLLEFKSESLENENADLWYDNMLKEARIEEHDNEIADLWYGMMTGGAI